MAERPNPIPPKDEDFTDSGIVRRYNLRGSDAENILDSPEQYLKRRAAEQAKAKAMAKALRKN